MPNKDKCVWAGRKVGFFKKVSLFFFSIQRAHGTLKQNLVKFKYTQERN